MFSLRALVIILFCFSLSLSLPCAYSSNTQVNTHSSKLYQRAFSLYQQYEKEVGYIFSHEEAKLHRRYYNLKFKALKLINQVLQKEPKFAKAYYLRARIWSRFSFDDANKMKFLAVGAGYDDFLRWRYLKLLANYNAAVKCDKDFALAYMGLFNLHISRHRGKALSYLNKAAELNFPLAYWERAWDSFFQGNYVDARHDMDQAISLDPGNARFHKGRAEVNWHLGNFTGAIDDVLASGCVVDKFDSDISNNDYRKILEQCFKNWPPPVNFIEVIDPDTVRVSLGSGKSPVVPGKNIEVTFSYWRGNWQENSLLRLEREF